MATLHVCSAILFVLVLPFAAPLYTQDDVDLILHGMREYITTGNEPKYLAKAMEQYPLPNLFRDDVPNVYDSIQICYMCNFIIDFVILERKAGLSRESIVEEAEYACFHLGIESQRVCTGVVELNIDVFLYIIDNHPNVTSNRFCGSVLQTMGCPKGPDYEWSIELPPGNSLERPNPTDPTTGINILHLSDIHYDPNYVVGGNAECGEPICCQEYQGMPDDPAATCGYWSDYRNADSPWHLVEEAIRHTKTQEFDYVIYTGDIISHRVWETSIPNNTATIAQLYSYFKEQYDVPVFPVFGNHEPHPLNLWPTESVTDEMFSIQWLFQLAANSWSELVGEDISETVLKGGYYSVSPRPGYRIIAINSNLCYTFNWWLIFEDRDRFGQLQWLADTLKQAEDNNESVHIITHIPTGTGDSLSVWGREFSRIVDRFANTIKGQFNGHTHKDQFYVYYNRSVETHPIGVAFNGAAVTPFSNSNPSYKIYKVEDEMFSLLDYEEWTFNLTLANSQPSDQSPEWYKLYSFIDTYGVETLDAVQVDNLLYKMADNHTLIETYFNYFYRNGDAGIRGGCGEACQKDLLCGMATTVFGEDLQCNRYLHFYDQAK